MKCTFCGCEARQLWLQDICGPCAIERHLTDSRVENDAAVQIAEEAFRAGFQAGWALWSKVYPARPLGQAMEADIAWDAFEPSEATKELTR